MTTSPETAATPAESGAPGLGRRSFLGYVIGGTTLVTAADWALAGQSASALPSAPSIPELYDLTQLIADAARPTADRVVVVLHDDGTASFSLPRSENGQGIVDSTAMILAEELELPVDKVVVTLSDARPDLLFNQFTGSSSTTISTFTPIRVAAAVAKRRLLEAAAIQLDADVSTLTARAGVIQDALGRTVTYGDLAARAAAAVSETVQVEVELKPVSSYRVIGRGKGRSDARAAVTGTKQYLTDLDVAGAMPTMVCRAPTLNGRPTRLLNEAEVSAMPGVTDVAVIDTGVAVRAATFGQCIDAVRAVRAEWQVGPVGRQSDDDVVAALRRVEVPLPPRLPDLPTRTTLESDTTYYFRSNSAMDTNSAIADVRPGSAEIWSAMKTPGAAQARIAETLGLPLSKVVLHVVQGGGSFGRRLFFDGALEAAKISQAMGKPVKLMWHRADDARVGRTHPLCTSRVQAVVDPVAQEVLSFTQRHTSVETDFRHGLGDLITANLAMLPPGLGNLTLSQTVFTLTQEMPYDFGLVSQTLVEPDGSTGLARDPDFNTGSMRNIYSPDVRTSAELMVDRIADAFGEDPLELRRRTLRSDEVRAVLDTVAEVGGWGRTMPAGTAQGIAIHKEYQGATACLVEIDCRPSATGRTVQGSPEYVTGPRVTKVTLAVDAGLVINPRGLEAQMQGGINDGIAQALTASLHLTDGHFVEASWDNYFYTRQWNHAPDVRVVVMPSTSDRPGGAGEAGVAPTMAAVACAHARALRSLGRTAPDFYPVNHRTPLPFEPKPVEPPVPESPIDGLRLTT